MKEHPWRKLGWLTKKSSSKKWLKESEVKTSGKYIRRVKIK
jgi:hypothetical protein